MLFQVLLIHGDPTSQGQTIQKFLENKLVQHKNSMVSVSLLLINFKLWEMGKSKTDWRLYLLQSHSNCPRKELSGITFHGVSYD